jgi:monothiol glutaredoxin
MSHLLISNWPTIPQVFINKEFIGGSDILKSLYESGELTDMLKNAGVELNPPKEN